jgi:type I restriction enzyme S subunit
MAGEWRNLSFTKAVLVNPQVRLERGRRYPFVDMGALNPGARSAFATEEREFSGGGSRFEHGDTLMARITPCLENGKIARFCAPERSGVGHGSTEFIVIRGRPGVTHTDFAYYLTLWEGVRGYAISHMTGTSGRQRVPTDCLEHLTVPIPPLPEQHAIAHILGTLDDKIELNRRMSETLEAMARALFKAWFVDFEPVRAKIEGRWQRGQSLPGLPAHLYDLFPDRLVDSELGKIPEGWKVGMLSDHFDAVKGVSYKGSGLRDSGLPLHNLNSIYEGGGYKYEGIKYYAGEYTDRHVVRPGDVIVANTEQGHDRLLIGYAAVVPRLFGDQGIASHHIYRLRPKPGGLLTPIYLCHLLNSPEMHDVVSGYANGTTVNMLPIDGLQKPKIICPPRTVVVAFDSLASNAEHRREETVAESRTLAALRDALLPKLISGEIRVKDAERFLKRRGLG